MSEYRKHGPIESGKMSEYEFIGALRKPNKLITSLLSEAGNDVDDVDKKLVTKILDKFRYRFTALSFLMMQENMSPDEKLGLVMYVGLVNVADDIIDANPQIVKDTDESKLRSDLLSREVVIKEPIKIGDKGITVQDLYDRTLSKFPPDKRTLIEDFLEKALRAEVSFPNREPGSYTSADAFNYRTQTSAAYSQTGSRLIGAKEDSEKLSEFITWGEVMQIIDDAMDAGPDWKGSINPLIAMAFENNEENVIEDLANSNHRDGTVSRLFQGRRMLRRMPKTRVQYSAHFQRGMDSLPESTPKHVLREISKLLF